MTRRRHAPGGAVQHVDDWLMTYADMITLLLCFFVVIVSTTIAHRQTAKRPIAVTMALTAVIPLQSNDFFEGNLPLHGVAHADHATEDAPPDIKEQKPEPIVAAAPAPAPVSLKAPPAAASAPAKIDAQVPPAPSPPPSPRPSEPKGNRITILEVSSATFFASGTATLSDAGEAMLRDEAVTLSSDAYKDYEITVEGHTDDTPIHTAQFPSNWELSTARAASVVRFLLDQGISADRMRAAGYADTFPKAPNRDATGNPIPENQASNRRVVIKAEKIEAADRAAGGSPAAPSPPRPST